MRHRRLFNAVCLLSLVLAIVVAALWARSVWWQWDVFTIETSGDTYVFGTRDGTFAGVCWSVGMIVNSPFADQGYQTWPASGETEWWPTIDEDVFVMPHWIVLASLLILPALRLRGASARGTGLCPRCGYDLRGSSGGGGACPECGEATPKPLDGVLSKA